MKTIDLRSDTVTRPTPAMREAIAVAEVGDDVYGEDPTVNLLQERAARLFGKEAALFVPTGTMGNQASLRALTRPGDVILAGEHAHLLVYESGAPAALWGALVKTIGEDGIFGGEDVRKAMHPGDSHFPPCTVLSVENTHNRAGGRIFPFELMKDATQAARDAGLRLHMDGARILHAVVATGVPAAAWAEPFDTISFCLSKGLGAPAGSVICTSRDLLGEIHRARKMLGGGMRQAGILAAAGLHALEHHVERLADDHANVRHLAAGLAALGFRIDRAPDTNILRFAVEDEAAFHRTTRDRGVLVNPIEPGIFRAVTHLDVSRQDVDDALARIAEVVAEGVR